MKVILDNNIWISYALGNHLDDLPGILQRADIEIYACAELFDEFERVRQYPKLLKILKPQRLVATIELMTAKAISITIATPTADFADAKDNYLLDLCKTVPADFLVTGDKLLLALNNYGQTRIITYRAFRDLLAIV
ncbi:MAG: putative toxin-antitoxin system toxin component, PIN family [Saprospiraceae bacterium]